MYERLEECPVCKHTQSTNKLICKDYLVSQESFALVECNKCKLLYTNPRPSTESLPSYYKSDNYVSHTSKGNNITNIIYKIARSFTLKSKHKLITKYFNKHSILDYGCGTGDFINYFKNKGWQVQGIEPDTDAKEIAYSKQLEVFSSISDIPNSEKFKVITLWHVLEHVSDLRQTIKLLKKHLDNDGIMIIAVPNCDSFDANYYDVNWAAYDVPRHLYHFNQETMAYLLKKAKLTLIDTLPMFLDSFYVSLLSEKNIYNKTKLFKAFQIGLKSNRFAKQNNNNYSSLIYVVKK